MYLVFILYALFASVFTIGKGALEYTQPLFLIGTRMFFAGGLMLAYQFIFHRKNFIFHRKDVLKVCALAFFNIYVTNVLEFWGLKYLTSFKTCFIYNLSPFISALLSYFVFSEVMSWKKWIGLLIGFLGFLPILITHSSSEELTGQIFFFSWAELAVMLAATTSVYGWILLKQLVHESGYSPFMANSLSMLIGGSLALIHSYAVEDWNPIPVTEFVPFLELALLLTLVSNLLAYNLYGFLLKKFSPTFMSFAGFTTPLFTALFGWVFLGETVTWAFFASTGIVFSGLFLFYQEELKKLTFSTSAC